MSKPVAKRPCIMQRVHSQALCSRSAFATLLQRLHEEGALSGDLGVGTHRSIRHRLQVGKVQVVDIETPYGPLLESMPIGATELPEIDIVNPFALLHTMIVKSKPLFDIFEECVSKKQKLSLLLYVDGMTPGNPLGHSHSRDSH